MSKIAGVYGFVVWVDNKAYAFWSQRGSFSHQPFKCGLSTKRICYAGRFQF